MRDIVWRFRGTTLQSEIIFEAGDLNSKIECDTNGNTAEKFDLLGRNSRDDRAVQCGIDNNLLIANRSYTLISTAYSNENIIRNQINILFS